MKKEDWPEDGTLTEEGMLIFVYNANAGWQEAFWDTLHKYMRPDTYGCNLCKLTHGPIGPRAAWKAFLRDCGRPVRFLHRDEYRALPEGRATEAEALPVVLEVGRTGPRVLLSAAELNALKDLEGLLGALENALNPR